MLTDASIAKYSNWQMGIIQKWVSSPDSAFCSTCLPILTLRNSKTNFRIYIYCIFFDPESTSWETGFTPKNETSLQIDSALLHSVSVWKQIKADVVGSGTPRLQAQFPPSFTWGGRRRQGQPNQGEGYQMCIKSPHTPVWMSGSRFNLNWKQHVLWAYMIPDWEGKGESAMNGLVCSQDFAQCLINTCHCSYISIIWIGRKEKDVNKWKELKPTANCVCTASRTKCRS